MRLNEVGSLSAARGSAAERTPGAAKRSGSSSSGSASSSKSGGKSSGAKSGGKSGGKSSSSSQTPYEFIEVAQPSSTPAASTAGPRFVGAGRVMTAAAGARGREVSFRTPSVAVQTATGGRIMAAANQPPALSTQTSEPAPAASVPDATTTIVETPATSAAAGADGGKTGVSSGGGGGGPGPSEASGPVVFEPKSDIIRMPKQDTSKMNIKKAQPTPSTTPAYVKYGLLLVAGGLAFFAYTKFRRTA